MAASVVISANNGAVKDRSQVTAATGTAGASDIEININPASFADKGECLQTLRNMVDMVWDYDWPAA